MSCSVILYNNNNKIYNIQITELLFIIIYLIATSPLCEKAKLLLILSN